MKNIFKAFAAMLAILLALMVPAGFALASGAANGNGTGNGANVTGPFDPTSPGPSDVNQGNGNAPENGTVGNADGKNPPGQVGNENDKGYECDDNKGVGDKGGNPAHTGCTTPTTSPTGTPRGNPSPSPSVSDKKVTICHATGSETNPFVEITISENALDAHFRDGHQRGEDVFGPCPAPTVKPTIKPSPTVEPTLPPRGLPSIPPTVKPTVKPTVRPTCPPSPFKDALTRARCAVVPPVVKPKPPAPKPPVVKPKPKPPVYGPVVPKPATPVATPTATVAETGNLPYTGNETQILLIAGLVMIAAGAGTIALTRKA